MMKWRAMSETVVLVDARNVVRSRWPNFREDRFVELTTEWAAREGVQPVIVFDGTAPADAIGTGPESADDWIAREAERLAGEGRTVWLVSSDRDLRDASSRMSMRLIGGGSFAGELERLSDLTR